MDDLVRRAQKGDMDAFGQLVTAQAPAVYRLARAYVGDGAAEDVAQEVFTSAWRALPGLREAASFGPWLHRIALNSARSAGRARGRVREIPMETPLADGLRDPADGYAPVEARSLVAPAFRRLSDDHRAVISLHYASGLSIHEVAAVLGIADGTAKSRLNAALEVLRRDVGRERP
jgi:RNA polymerase sigma factor (sigma-70 family)